MARTTVNKDGSVTTSDEDEQQTEVKVVEPEGEKPTPKGRSKAETK